MTKTLRVLPLACLALLSGCSGDQLTRTFGLTRDAPDEFQVTTRAPLSMPPTFALRPPQPGAPRPQELTARQQAEAALVPDSINQQQQQGGNLTSGEQALVAEAGPAAPQGIRREVNREAALETPDRSFADMIMFWRKPAQQGTVVDPVRESQRLRQNQALGQPVDTGDTPIIQRDHSVGGLLGNLF